MKKGGFTLIEVLIVIVIIGILAVAFLPSILAAPSKARDTQRIADVQKLQKVIMSTYIEGVRLPLYYHTYYNCLGIGGYFNDWLTSLGGAVPVDPGPQGTEGTHIGNKCPTSYGGRYYYVNFVDGGGDNGYAFGFCAEVENTENGNIKCSDVPAPDDDDVTLQESDDTTDCYCLFT